jgi:O-antigen/teichoic acid export membrane protein
MKPASETQPLRKRATWVVIWRVVGIATTLASNILAARLLGPAEFGIYLLVVTVMALGGLLGMAGLNEAGLRFISESLAFDRHGLARAYLKRMLTAVAIASLAAAGLTAIGMIAFQAETSRFPQPTILIALTALGIIALAWQQIAAESLRGYGDLKLASMFSGGQTGGPISNLLLLAGFAVTSWMLIRLNATLAVALTVGSIALTFPLALVSAWRKSGGPQKTDEAPASSLSHVQSRQLLTVGGVLLVNQLLAFASQQFDIWIGGAMLSPESLGLYGAAKRSLLLAAMPVQMAMMVVMATIPRLYAQQRTQELERVVRSAAFCAAIPAFAAIVLLALFPEQVLRLAFGGSYSGAASTVLVLIVGYLVLIISGSPPYVLTMTGHHHAVVVVNAIAALVLVVGGVLGAKYCGAPGLAAGSTLSFALQNGLLWWIARRRLGIWTHIGLPVRLNETKQTPPAAIMMEV